MTTGKTTSFVVALALAGVAQVALMGTAGAQMDVPPLAALGPPPVPADNPQTPEKIELGRLLFFDTRLGGDASTACSTCHEPGQGWAFGDDFSRGGRRVPERGIQPHDRRTCRKYPQARTGRAGTRDLETDTGWTSG